jgi:chaperonin cofactor prefoldin
MRERIERIDELNSRIEQLRDQNRRLDEEAERLAKMVPAAAENGLR